MAYLLDLHKQTPSIEEIRDRYRQYYQYLDSIKDQLPEAARSFALAAWHYNHNAPTCPHDAWVETLNIREPSSGERHEVREIEISVVLLGAYHDGYIELTYQRVGSYSLTTSSSSEVRGHGDWLIDEVRLSEKGQVLHEVVFLSGARWLIICEDIQYQWKPFDSEH